MIIILIILVLVAILLTPTIYRRYISNSKLILIEGLDCSGKKTLARKLAQYEFEGYSTRVNIGALLKTPVSTMADRFTYNWKLSNSIRSYLYAITYILDGLFFMPRQNKVIVQVSYYPRHFAYNKAMELKNLLRLNTFFSFFYIHFDLVIYLFADYEERLKRHSQQYPPENEIQSIESRFMLNEKSRYLRWEQLLNENIDKRYKNKIIIDTTNKSIDSIIQTLDFKNKVL